MLVKNIVFDLGNVILNINPELSVKAFEAIGIQNFDQLYTLAAQTELFDKLETGRINENEFCDVIRSVYDVNLKNSIIIGAWNSLILDFPSENLELLKSTRNKYRTFILSNTNQIHYNFYSADLRNNHQINGLESLVEKTFFSHNAGYRKPDLCFYKHLEEQTGVLPSETLFIDDSALNCEAAEKLGWLAIEYNEKSLPLFFKRNKLPF